MAGISGPLRGDLKSRESAYGRLQDDSFDAAPAASLEEQDHLTRDDRANLFRFMFMMRASEERALTLYRQGKVPGSFYDGRGQEAISVGSSFVLGPRDRMCILHRDLGAHFVRGVTPDRYLANYMGRADGVTGGKDGNMHFGDRRLGCIGMVSMLPDMASVSTGLALAFKMRSEPRVAMTYFGEGATANGQCHEALNFAGIHSLPVVFVLENNRFAYSTPTELEFAVDPVKRAEGYGFPGTSVDGNDVEAVFEASRVAAERARSGGGPTLIQCHTMRMHGHGAHDDMRYVPKELLEEWEARDPIERYAERLVDLHEFPRAELEAIREEVSAYVDECARIALESPMPEPRLATEGVYAESWEPLGDGKAPWSWWNEQKGPEVGSLSPNGSDTEKVAG
jgi:TPP-dependent pyruvate/acetoin dehydrogenase alpha subunit